MIISLYVVSLSTNVLIGATVDIMTRHIYENKKIDTRISKNKLKEIIITL